MTQERAKCYDCYNIGIIGAMGERIVEGEIQYLCYKCWEKHIDKVMEQERQLFESQDHSVVRYFDDIEEFLRS